MKAPYSKTKIIATLGPASDSPQTLEQLVLAGVNIFRLNFSHGTHEQHGESIRKIRKLQQKLGQPIGILADLQGPKLRIGEIENGHITLADGDEIEITHHECIGNKQRVFLSYPNFARDVHVGNSILVDDGKIKLEVISTNQKDRVKARVVHGGKLSSRKGVNLPDTKISLPSLTEKDIQDAHFAIENQVDWLALSFVRNVTDIMDLHDLIKKYKKQPWIIAKIEKPEALEGIDQIIDMSKAIMIARGDLGVEVPFDKVPVIQKDIIQRCINQSKPVIIATQMMESMIENFRPTRAEATDVANAVLDGADCLMLSGETSVGKYPLDVVRNMKSIIRWTEQHGFHYLREHPPVDFSPTFLPESVCYHACKMAEQTRASAIVTFTHSGATALYIASHRPNARVFAFTGNKDVLNKLTLVYGVQAFYMDSAEKIEEAVAYSIDFLKKKNLIRDEEVIVHVGSTPVNQRGRTNMLKVSYV